MNEKEKIIEQITNILKKVDDTEELKDMLSMITIMYNNHKIND